MSFRLLKDVFNSLETMTNRSLQLLNIITARQADTRYNCRQITLYPYGRLTKLISDITTIYIENGKKSIDSFREIREYDGTANGLTIYSLNVNNELIAAEYEAFIQAIADPNIEDDPFEYTSAYLLKGQMAVNEIELAVKLISMQNPVTTLKHKFLYEKGAFKELSKKVLSLKPTMDIIIIGETVFFLTLAGERLFNMPRAYRAVCARRVEEIQAANIISGFDNFEMAATTGHNPRRFVAFNENRLAALQNPYVRINMANRFSIPVEVTGDRFDATSDGATEKIIKLLCNKGVVDPFEDAAVEVDGFWRWQ